MSCWPLSWDGGEPDQRAKPASQLAHWACLLAGPVRFVGLPIASVLPPSLHLVSSSALQNQPTSRLCLFSSLRKSPYLRNINLSTIFIKCR